MSSFLSASRTTLASISTLLFVRITTSQGTQDGASNREAITSRSHGRTNPPNPSPRLHFQGRVQCLSQPSDSQPDDAPTFLTALVRPVFLLPPRRAAAAQLVLFRHFYLFQSRFFFFAPAHLLPLWDGPPETQRSQGARLAIIINISRHVFLNCLGCLLINLFSGDGKHWLTETAAAVVTLGFAWACWWVWCLLDGRRRPRDFEKERIPVSDILRALLLIPARHDDGPIHLLIFRTCYAFQSCTLRIPDRLGFFHRGRLESQQKRLAQWFCAHCAVAAGFFAACAPLVVCAYLARPHISLGRGVAIIGGGVGFVTGLAWVLSVCDLLPGVRRPREAGGWRGGGDANMVVDAEKASRREKGGDGGKGIGADCGKEVMSEIPEVIDDKVPIGDGCSPRWISSS